MTKNLAMALLTIAVSLLLAAVSLAAHQATTEPSLDCPTETPMNPINRDRVLTVLARHIGAANGVRADQLTAEVTGQPSDDATGQRQLREVIVGLRREGHHICGHPKSGYYLAATPDELTATCEFLYDRAICSLEQIAAMKRISLPDLRGQLHLPT